VAAAIPVADPLRVHFENLPGPAYLWQRAGDDFVLVGYNHAAADVSVSRIANLVGRRTGDVTGSGAAEARAALARCLDERTVVSFETDFVYPSTHVRRRLVLTIVPVSADTAIVHTDDVTERRRTDERLRESLQRYELAVRGTDDGIWDWNLLTNEVYYSPRWLAILGYEEDELPQHLDTFLNLVHPDDRVVLWTAVERHLSHRTPLDVDVRLRHKSGAHVWANSRGQAAWDESGKPLRMAGSIRDITTRKVAEQRLTESEARYRALVEGNPDVVFRVDRRGRYRDLSVRNESSLPFSSDEFVGRAVSELMGPEFAAVQQHYVEEALAKRKLQIWEHQLEIDGKLRHLESRFARSTDDEVVVIVRDVTERVELQREVIDIEERERSRIGRDIHDGLGQSLTAISLALKQLSQQLERKRSPHRAAVQRIMESVRSCIGETGRIARDLTPVVAENYGLREALARLAEEVNATTGVRCSFRAAVTHSNHCRELEAQLYRIAQEAVGNALRHASPSTIEIDYGCDDAHSRLELSDDGCGIAPAEDLVAGLGLRSMRYRASLIGAELEVARRPEGGTRVTCVCRRRDEQRRP
jgi:PAS domain S-box-containing protein